MFNTAFFLLGEFYRTLKKAPLQFLYFLNLSLLSYCGISLMCIFLFNSNYIVEIFDNSDELPGSIARSSMVFLNINRNRHLLYTMIILLIISLLYINKKFLQDFIINYESELELMARLNLKNRLKRSPLIYAAILGNVFSLITSWSMMFLIYGSVRNFLILQHLNIILLKYNQFKLTLFLILLTIGLATCLPVAIYSYRYVIDR